MTKEIKEEKQRLDGYFNRDEMEVGNGDRISVSSTTSVFNHPGVAKLVDTTTPTQKTTNIQMVTPENKRKQVQCMYCGNEYCHNQKFGKYLYQVCADWLGKNKKDGIKTEYDHVERLFRQRYHVLAEWDAFHLHNCDEFEQRSVHKTELPECIKHGYFSSVEHMMKKTF